MTEPSVDIADKAHRKRIASALGMIPQSLYVLTVSHNQQDRGMLVSWVQQVSFEPPMVVVAVSKGRQIVPILHDARAFALSQVDDDDRVTLKRFAETEEFAERLLGLETVRRATGAPILASALSFLDCELARHIDVDGDHDLYVGRILDADVLNEGKPPVHMRKDGLSY